MGTAVAVIAGHLAALMPAPPTPPKQAHRMVESRTERLSRWRNDLTIAASALVANIPLLHNNAQDFETIRACVETRADEFVAVGPLNLVQCIRILQR